MLEQLAELRRQISKLKESEERFRAIMEATTDFIFIKDTDRRYSFVNQAIHKVLGLSGSETIGKTSEEIFGSDQGGIFKEIDDRSFSGETVNEIMSLAIGNKKLVFNSIQTPLTSEDGKITSIMGIVRDVTEHKKVDDALKISESEKSLILDNMSELIVYRDKDMKTIWASKSVALWLDKTPEEVVGRICYKDRYGLDAPCKDCHAMKTLITGEPYKGIRSSPDGKYWDVTIDPARNDDGDIIGIIEASKDITERKKAMGEKEKLEAQLRQSQKMEAVGQLAGGVAHDFNNLLQVINGYTDLALKKVEADSYLHKSLEEVLKAADQATILIRQLLAFSRRQVLEMEDINLNDVIANLMKMISPIMGEHLTLDVVAGHDLGIVRADKGQIEQILINLCVNARDAMPTGGTVTIETENVRIDEEYRKTHSWVETQRYVLMSVTDTGCGMDEETVGKIFEPFFTTKGVSEGTGLGLSTVYGLVKQHGGMVLVYSEVGKGSTFKVYLPQVERSATLVGNKIEGPVSGGTETILLAEDDEMVCELNKTILEHAGYTVLTASDGEEALCVFEDHADEVDMVILDVVMPKIGGRAVYEQIREKYPQIRVLFASGYSINSIHTNFVLDEGLMLIQKPCRPDDLLRRVREVIVSREEESE